ncbi:MAG: TolC family protein [Psychrosphaera sp.]|nr:TolC family protein [Psychrosphaera sp.]
MYLYQKVMALLAMTTFSSPVLAQEQLTLEIAIKVAHKYDHWLVGNRHNQQAIEAMSVAAGTMDDPRVSIGMANLAVDSFDFSQEPMTQLKVGVSQMLPRGDSLAIKQNQLSLMASQHPLLRQDRRAKVAVEVAKLWLDAYKAQQSIVLIEQSRVLFEQLADVAQASYSTAIGKTRQHDIVRAELELTRLEDRLAMLKHHLVMSSRKLSQWLGEVPALRSLSLPSQLPNIQMKDGDLANHPALKALEQKIKASGSGITLAKQKYQPQWGLNASYGYRGNAPMGGSRADLFSVGVSFDIPIFTGNRQDKEVQSAISRTEAVKSDKLQLLRQLTASMQTTKAHLHRLYERHTLYRDRLMPQIHEQAEASLTAYTNDEGNFTDVVRGRIAELDGQIEVLGIDVDTQKTLIQLNYFFITSGDHQVAKAAHRTGLSL